MLVVMVVVMMSVGVLLMSCMMHVVFVMTLTSVVLSVLHMACVCGVFVCVVIDVVVVVVVMVGCCVGGGCGVVVLLMVIVVLIYVVVWVMVCA